MKINRITIKADLAHFKIPARAKIQQTYEIPPISTVIGILQNIYGKEINDFILGYKINYKCKNRDLMIIYKELNLLEKTHTDKKRFMRDTCIVEYLYNVELTIYTNINQEILLEDVLTLGKANCLASIREIKELELIDKKGHGYNQYTCKSIGEGQIRRINTITKFNENSDMYDIKTAIVRENIEFEYDKNYDEDIEQSIYLWNWKDGDIIGIN
ncbi:MAG: CRISPR-associated protein Cas5 [Terrisporobacter sp.]